MADDPRNPTWTLRVTAKEAGPAQVHARTRQFPVGDPVSFDAAYPETTALEYALGAAGAELVNGLRAMARDRRLALEAVEALVSGSLEDTLAYLGVVGAAGRPVLRRVAVKLYASSLEDEAALRAAFEQVLRRSPLLQTLRLAGVDVTAELKISP